MDDTQITLPEAQRCDSQGSGSGGSALRMPSKETQMSALEGLPKRNMAQRVPAWPKVALTPNPYPLHGRRLPYIALHALLGQPLGRRLPPHGNTARSDTNFALSKLRGHEMNDLLRPHA